MYQHIRKCANGAKDLLRDTAAEVLIAPVILATTLGMANYIHQQDNNRIPLSFTELRHLERQADDRGIPLEPLNRFYPSTVDLANKIFESDNTSKDNSGERERNLAFELDMRTDPTLQIYDPNMTDLIEDFKEDRIALDALDALRGYQESSASLTQVIGRIEASWTERHYEDWDTRIVICTETYTDSSGETQTRTTTCQERYCDQEEHTYWYHKEHGDAALELLQGARDIEGFDYSEDFIIATETLAEGEYGMDKSRPMQERLKRDEYILIANSWFEGNNFRQHRNPIVASWRGLLESTDDLAAANQSASKKKKFYYETPCGFKRTPKEYDVAHKLMGRAKQTRGRMDNVLEGIRYAHRSVPQLERKIEEIIAVEMDGKEGDSKELREDILGIAGGLLTKNFGNHYQTMPIDRKEILLMSLIGIGLGIPLGWAWDRTGKHFGWWDTNW